MLHSKLASHWISQKANCLGDNACSTGGAEASITLGLSPCYLWEVKGRQSKRGTLLAVPELTFLAGAAALGNRAGAELDRTTQRPLSAAHSMDMPPK